MRQNKTVKSADNRCRLRLVFVTKPNMGYGATDMQKNLHFVARFANVLQTISYTAKSFILFCL